MDRQRRWGADRGQLVIVVALVLALTLVALALILNSGIFAENLSTGETTDSDEVALAAETAFDETAVAMRATNRAGDETPEAAGERFASDLENIGDAVVRERSLRGQAFEIRLLDQTNGTSLQQNESQVFTEGPGGADDWELAGNIDAIAGYHLLVERNTLAEPTTFGDDTFYVRIDNGTDVWQIHVFENNNEVVVAGGDVTHLDSEDEIDKLPAFDNGGCRENAETVEIDLAEETLNGTHCPALSFADNLTGELTLSYRNGSKAGGTYRLLVTENANIGGGFNEPGEDSPFESPAVFSADIRVTYDRADISYDRQRTVYAEPLVYETEG